jgi:hypothetical protein
MVNTAQPVSVTVLSKAACYQNDNDSRVLSMYRKVCITRPTMAGMNYA